MTFSEALEVMKKGGKVRRQVWPDKFTCLFIVKPNPSVKEASNNSYIEMRLNNDEYVPAALNSDILRNDWEEATATGGLPNPAGY